MPWLVALLIGGLIDVCKTLVGRVLVALGVGFVTYSGVNLAVQAIRDLFVSNISGSGQWILGAAYLLRVDVAFGIIMAAVVARFTVAGLTSGSLKKMIYK